jgi:hypothetical protein
MLDEKGSIEEMLRHRPRTHRPESFSLVAIGIFTAIITCLGFWMAIFDVIDFI